MSKLPLSLLLNNVRSLHNVGAIMRTAEATHCQEIILSGLTPVPPRHEIEKTSLGALANLSWQYVENALDFIHTKKKEGYRVIALEQAAEAKPIFLTKLTFPILLIVGHEREGVEPEILAVSDFCLEIPIQGEVVHSLNVSNATSIALYEAVRQFWYH